MMERFLGKPLDSKAIPKAVLDIAHKERSNLFPWNGQFSPQLAEALLKSFAAGANRVLDPFVGSGTVFREAARLGKEAFGTEINPAAYKMGETYKLMGLANRERKASSNGWKTVWLMQFQIACPCSAMGIVKPLRCESGHSRRAARCAERRGRIVIEALIILLDFFKECIRRES